MEPLTLLAFVAMPIALVLVGVRPSTRMPTAVESFNDMAAEAGRHRSKQEWALRIGLGIGLLVTFTKGVELRNHGELRPPADLILPLMSLAGAACALPLRFRFWIR